jgi:plasmid replication initiation protein
MEHKLARRGSLESLKNKFLVQHNLITEAYYDLTACEKNIFYMIVAQLREDDPPDKVYYISIPDMETLTRKSLNYKQVFNSATRLVERVYKIKNGKDLLAVAIISSAKYIEGSACIAVRMDPEIRPYLFGLKTEFTKYGFVMAFLLSGRYPKQLYEMLSQFKQTGILRMTVDELKYRLGVKDIISGKDKYAIWTMFAQKVLETSRLELEKHTDINFTYQAKKQGRRYTDLEFKISSVKKSLSSSANLLNTSSLQTNLQSLTIETNSDVMYAFKRLVETNQLSSWQATIIVENIPVEFINKDLHTIKLKSIAGEIKKSIGGYTANFFAKKYNLNLTGGKV